MYCTDLSALHGGHGEGGGVGGAATWGGGGCAGASGQWGILGITQRISLQPSDFLVCFRYV